MKVAKEDFLWFKKGDEINEDVYQTNWEAHVEESELESKLEKVITDFKKEAISLEEFEAEVKLEESVEEETNAETSEETTKEEVKVEPTPQPSKKKKGKR